MVVGQLIVWAGLRAGNSVPLVLVGWAVGFLASGLAMALPFSVLAESVDFGEWKTGIRAAGLLTAIGAAFCLKAGAGLGAAIPGWILDAAGYTPGAKQSAAALHGIEVGALWLPTVTLALAAVPVFFYRRYERMEPEILAALDARRRGNLPTG